MPEYDAVVVGAGPNGLAAAIELERSGWSVLLVERAATIGGGVRSAELTLPGFVHDICSAIHPLGKASPFFRSLPLDQFGLEWISPEVQVAHPFDDRPPAVMYRSLEATGETLGEDSQAYQNMMEYYVKHWEPLMETLLGPFQILPKHPLLLALFGIRALPSVQLLNAATFNGIKAKSFFAGLAAHSIIPLERIPTASFGLVLGLLGHAVGWVFPKGGAQRISDAMGAYFTSLGGKIQTDFEVKNIDDLPSARAYVFDVTPRQLLSIAGHKLPEGYRRALRRYRYGQGSFKVDFALDGPIPWKDAECAKAGTLHLGGTYEEIARSERVIWQGKEPEHPYTLIAQHGSYDTSRAPEGQQTCWAYCHVPHGSTVDMTERITAQIERFAPGFRDRILATHIYNPVMLEQHNPNYVGGDINGGVQDIFQLFTRPAWRYVPYSTPAKDIFICSSSTPPGGGVHGMGGYHAARAVMKRHK